MNYLTYLYKTKSSVLYEKRFSSSEEEVAKWHFNKMDRNSDGVSTVLQDGRFAALRSSQNQQFCNFLTIFLKKMDKMVIIQA